MILGIIPAQRVDLNIDAGVAFIANNGITESFMYRERGYLLGWNVAMKFEIWVGNLRRWCRGPCVRFRQRKQNGKSFIVSTPHPLCDGGQRSKQESWEKANEIFDEGLFNDSW